MKALTLARLARITLLALGAAFFATAASAQPYPAHTITLVCPYSPGTGIDIVARIIAQKLGADGKYTMVVKNQPGASGNIGADVVAKAPPDATRC